MLDLFLTNCKNGFSFTLQLWISYLLIRGLVGSRKITEIIKMDKETNANVFSSFFIIGTSWFPTR